MRSTILALLAVVSVSCGDRRINAPDAGLAATDALVSADGGVRLVRLGPDRGPYTGGQLVSLFGRGFLEGTIRVDGVDVPERDVRTRTETRLGFVTPPHPPGIVDVSVRVGAETSTLVGGYTYDAIVVEPPVAPLAGGAPVTIRGAATTFQDGDAFLFGARPCDDVEVVSPTEVRCRVPQGPRDGPVDVAQRRGADTLASALGAFRYVDAPFTSGGVAGEAIDGALDVRLIGDFGPISDALVVVVTDDGGELRARTGADGRARLAGPGLIGPVTVHAGHPCYARSSFVGVDANELTIPLAIHRTGAPCPERGEPGTSGFGSSGIVEGRLVFVEDLEFPSPTRRWTGVPDPREGERKAAIVGNLSAYSDASGALVPGAARVLESAWNGEDGFTFRIPYEGGSQRVCAVAGIEPVPAAGVDFAPTEIPGMRAFVLGCSDRVVVPTGGEVTGVVIPMIVPTTSALEIDVRALPSVDVATQLDTSTVSTVTSSIQWNIFLTGWPGIYWDETLDLLAKQGIAPRTVRFQRLPDPALWWNTTLANVSIRWGAPLGFSVAQVPVSALDGPLAVTPLGVPDFLAPRPLERIATGTTVRFEIEGEIDLLRLEVRPASYTAGGPIPPWNLFADDRRELLLPAIDDATEFALPPELYRLLLEAEQREDFDFDSWSFDALALSAAPRFTRNQIFVRVR